MKKKTFIVMLKLAFVTVIALGFLFPFNQAIGAKHKWKFAGGVPGMIDAYYMKIFKECLSKKSNGEIELVLYYLGELGTSKEMSELLQTGGIQFAFTDPGHFAASIKELEIFNVPYIFPEGMDEIKEVLSNKKARWFQILSNSYKKQNLNLLDIIPFGWSAWTSNRPLRTLDDFKGFKMRVMPAPLLVELYKLLGANPTATPFGEVYSALQLKMVDGQDNPISLVEAMKFHEVQDYITFSHHLMMVTTLSTNLPFFKGLPKEHQKIILEAAGECYNLYYLELARRERELREKIKKNRPSIQFTELTSEEIEPFRRAVMPVRDEYVEIAGESGKLVMESLFEEIKKVRKE